jgi:methanogenic corrinoid protein MtbC1
MFGPAPHPSGLDQVVTDDVRRAVECGRRVSPPSASRDRALTRTIETELVPRFMMAHQPDTPTTRSASADAPALSPEDLEAFLAEVLGPDDAAAAAFVRARLADGVNVESVYLDLLAPTARALGLRWEEDECSFVDVTVAMGRLQRVLRELSLAFQHEGAAPTSGGHVLLTCLPGEQHTLGLIMVAEFLIRDGFRVHVGAPWSEADLLTLVQTEWFDVIGFSAGCESRLSTMKREIQRIRTHARNPRVQILVGGQVFSLDPELVTRVGADGWARDARESPTVARELVLAASRGLDASGQAADAPTGSA